MRKSLNYLAISKRQPSTRIPQIL